MSSTEKQPKPICGEERNDIICFKIINFYWRYAEFFQTQVALQRIKLWNSITGLLGTLVQTRNCLLCSHKGGKENVFSWMNNWQSQVFGPRVLTGDDDLLISSDVDEVISRAALMKLKHCQVKAEVISAALWMPLGNLNRSNFYLFLNFLNFLNFLKSLYNR